jgi:hypothetical protein
MTLELVDDTTGDGEGGCGMSQCYECHYLLIWPAGDGGQRDLGYCYCHQSKEVGYGDEACYEFVLSERIRYAREAWANRTKEEAKDDA